MVTSDRSSLFLWLSLFIIFPKEKLHWSRDERRVSSDIWSALHSPWTDKSSVTAFTLCKCTLVICVLYASTIQYSTVFFFHTQLNSSLESIDTLKVAFSQKAIYASRSYKMFSLVSITRPLTDSSLGASPLFVQQRVRACSQATKEQLQLLYREKPQRKLWMQTGIHALKIGALGGSLFSLILSIPTVNYLQPCTTSRMIKSPLKRIRRY